MTIFREISLTNGQTLKNIKYAGNKDEFEISRKTEFEIELERQNTMTADKIHLLTDAIVYYIFDDE